MNHEQQDQLSQKPSRKTWQIVAIVVAGVLVIGGIAYGLFRQFFYVKLCTQEAKQCVDGSYIGRTGPNCEFTECPNANANSSTSPDKTTGWPTYKNERYGFEIKLPERWKEYKAVEKNINKEDAVGAVNFQLKNKIGEYGDIFLIDIFPVDWWNKNTSINYNDEVYLRDSEETLGNFLGSYLAKNNKYAFTYFIGHDDEGFLGFSDVIEDQLYQGPFYDVENFIVPSFKLIK